MISPPWVKRKNKISRAHALQQEITSWTSYRRLGEWVASRGNIQNFIISCRSMHDNGIRIPSKIYNNSIRYAHRLVAADLIAVQSPMFRQSRSKNTRTASSFFHAHYNLAPERIDIERTSRDLEMDSVVYGHLGYPVLQAADILLYKGEVVRSVKTNCAYRNTRELARRFMTICPGIPRTGGDNYKISHGSRVSMESRMSSRGNTISSLFRSPEAITKKLKTAVTDAQKVRKGDPAHPDICWCRISL